MSQKESFTVNRILSLIGIFGAMFVFAVILYVAYLPARPSAIDREVAEKRKQDADEARAAGLAKITSYEMNAGSGLVRIPIKEAMDLTVMEYQTEN